MSAACCLLPPGLNCWLTTCHLPLQAGSEEYLSESSDDEDYLDGSEEEGSEEEEEESDEEEQEEEEEAPKVGRMRASDAQGWGLVWLCHAEAGALGCCSGGCTTRTTT